MFPILFVVLVFVLMVIGFASIASSQTRRSTSPARSSYNDDPEAYLNIDKGIHRPIVNPDDTFEGLYSNLGVSGTYVSYMDTPMPTAQDEIPESTRLYDDDSFSSFDYDNDRL